MAVVGDTEGIDKATDIVGGSESWWTVAFAASDKDAFVASDDVVVIGQGEANCWADVVVGIVLVETKVR